MKNKTLNIRGRLFVFEEPAIMGILNATPDSFYNKGRLSSNSELLKTAEKMMTAGAAFLDIGGMSTNPKSKVIPSEEEWRRISPVIKDLKKEFPKAFLSVDTYRSEIALRAADEGADIINDISAGEMDKKMPATVAKLQLPYIAMHMQGTPQTMQNNPQYENVVKEIFDYFVKKTEALEAAGITDIIIDPGFGFGKTIAQNYQLIKELNIFNLLEKPILAGLSRKSMIYKLLGNTPEEALSATIALNTMAVQKGVDILRVHDVEEAKDVIRIMTYLKNVNS